MKKLIALLSLGVALHATTAFAAPADDWDQFVYDLSVYVHHAGAVEHDGIWKMATNLPFTGIVQERWIDQGAHGGLSVIVGAECVDCSAITHFYSNGDGTYNTITVYILD